MPLTRNSPNFFAKFLLLFTTFTLSFNVSCAYCLNEEPVTLREIDKAIIDTNIRLLKVSILARREIIGYTKRELIGTEQKQSLRLALYNVLGFGAIDAGAIDVAYIGWKYNNHPNIPSQAFLNSGPILSLTGHSILFSGALTEIALNIIRKRKFKNLKIDKVAYTKFLTENITKLNSLLNKRKTIQANNLNEDVNTSDINVLTEVSKFTTCYALRTYAVLQKDKYAQGVFDTLFLLNAGVGGYMGALLDLIAISHNRLGIEGPAGIGFTISGAIIATTPIITNLVAKHTFKKALKEISAKTNMTNTDLTRSQLSSELNKLKANLTQLNPSDLTNSDNEALKNYRANLGIYKKLDTYFEVLQNVDQSINKSARKALIRTSLVNAINGGCKIGFGVQVAHTGFAFRGNTLPQYKEAFKRLAEAATTFIPGPTLAVSDIVEAKSQALYTKLRYHKPGNGRKLTIVLDDLESLK